MNIFIRMAEYTINYTTLSQSFQIIITCKKPGNSCQAYAPYDIINPSCPYHSSTGYQRILPSQ